MTIGYTTGYRPTADEIADMADSGRDISEFFTNQGTMKQLLTRVNVDFTPDMLQELDQLAAELCASRHRILVAGFDNQNLLDSCLTVV